MVERSLKWEAKEHKKERRKENLQETVVEEMNELSKFKTTCGSTYLCTSNFSFVSSTTFFIAVVINSL